MLFPQTWGILKSKALTSLSFCSFKLFCGYKDFEQNHIWLVVSTPLKNIKVSWDDEIPN